MDQIPNLSGPAVLVCSVCLAVIIGIIFNYRRTNYLPDRVDKRFDDLANSLDKRIDDFRSEMIARIDALEKRVVDRLDRLEHPVLTK